LELIPDNCLSKFGLNLNLDDLNLVRKLTIVQNTYELYMLSDQEEKTPHQAGLREVTAPYLDYVRHNVEAKFVPSSAACIRLSPVSPRLDVTLHRTLPTFDLATGTYSTRSRWHTSIIYLSSPHLS
jgi:hypothetical protein